jgi:hypothetical protein
LRQFVVLRLDALPGFAAKDPPGRGYRDIWDKLVGGYMLWTVPQRLCDVDFLFAMMEQVSLVGLGEIPDRQQFRGPGNGLYFAATLADLTAYFDKRGWSYTVKREGKA